MMASRPSAEKQLETVAEIAHVVGLLAEEKSSWVNGQVIDITGGISGVKMGRMFAFLKLSCNLKHLLCIRKFWSPAECGLWKDDTLDNSQYH
jgi:hypothetical protein